MAVFNISACRNRARSCKKFCRSRTVGCTIIRVVFFACGLRRISSETHRESRRGGPAALANSGGACQSNSYTAIRSARKSLKCFASRLRKASTISPKSTTKSAALSLATGLTCCSSFRRKTNELNRARSAYAVVAPNRFKGFWRAVSGTTGWPSVCLRRPLNGVMR